MALTSGSQGATGTPAGTFYTTLTGLMTSAGWTLLETATAAQAGNTGDANENVPVNVWKNGDTSHAGTVFVLISQGETATPRLRFRVCEEYAKVQTITLTTPAAGNSFKLTYLTAEGATAFVVGTNCTAAAIQAALRTATGDTLLTVSGSTDTGPFTVTFTNEFKNDLLTATSVTGGTLAVAVTNDHKMQYPCPGNQSNTSMTPGADDGVASGPHTIYQSVSTTAKVGWMDIFVSAAGFNYVAGANAYEVVVTTSASQQNWFHGGLVRTADNLSPSSSLCFLGGRATVSGTNCSWTMGASSGYGNYRVSRQPNQGANGYAGAFCYVSDTVFGAQDDVDAGAGGQPGLSHKWLANFAAHPAYLHNTGTSWTGDGCQIRSHLCQLSSMMLIGHDTVALMAAGSAVGDTVSIDGETYYLFGPTHIVISSSVMPQSQCKIACFKSSRF